MDNLKSKTINRMVIVAVFSALVGISGLVLTIPLGTGYINTSDIFIILVACFIDPISGMLVGMIGGGLIDFFAGYPIYIPFTIIFKGLEGLLAGYCFKKIKQKWLSFISIMLVALFCVSLYFVADSIIASFEVALISLPGNLLQATINSFVALGLVVALKKRYFNHTPKS